MTSEKINTPELSFTPKGLLIGGKWEESSNGKRFETINPSNQKYLGDVPLADESDVDRAVKAAKKASAKGPAPRKIAIKISRIWPRILLIIVKKLNVVVDLNKFINHIGLKIASIVYLITLNEKN